MKYEEPSRCDYLVLEVLPFLYGQPWDEFAKNFIASLRPSSVRVIGFNEAETTDSWLYRVTVHLDKDGTIQNIEQEVLVGLDGGYEHGHALWEEGRKRGIL